MPIKDLRTYLSGGDLRSIARADQLLPSIKDQKDFDELFNALFSDDRLLIMRAADTIEKITINRPELLTKQKSEIVQFLHTAKDKEFKWHLAQMVSRLLLEEDELSRVWAVLYNWAKNEKESKIVRVNSLQALYDLSQKHIDLKKYFEQLAQQIKKENIPSLNARIHKLGCVLP